MVTPSMGSVTDVDPGDPIRRQHRLRDLDAQIETVELLLRQTVADSVDGDAGLLPPHVLQKIDE